MTYEALQLKDSEILDVLYEARKQKIVTMIHAENGAIIDVSNSGPLFICSPIIFSFILCTPIYSIYFSKRK